MSTHPNVILMAVFTPDGLTRKTLSSIKHDSIISDGNIEINGDTYFDTIMEDDYDDNFQISASEGDIVIHNHITYGYGEFISWDDAEKKKKVLEAWAIPLAKKHNCKVEIRLSANYW